METNLIKIRPPNRTFLLIWLSRQHYRESSSDIHCQEQTTNYRQQTVGAVVTRKQSLEPNTTTHDHITAYLVSIKREIRHGIITMYESTTIRSF